MSSTPLFSTSLNSLRGSGSSSVRSLNSRGSNNSTASLRSNNSLSRNNSRVSLCEDQNTTRTFTRTDILNKIIVFPNRDASAAADAEQESKHDSSGEDNKITSHCSADTDDSAEAHQQLEYTYVFTFRNLPPPANLGSGVAGWEKIVFTELSVVADSIRGTAAVSQQLEAKARKPSELVMSFTLDDWATSTAIRSTTPPPAGVADTSTTEARAWTLSAFAIPCGAGSRFAALMATGWSESGCAGKQLQVRAKFHRSESVCMLDVLACRVHVPTSFSSQPPYIQALELAAKETQQWWTTHRSALKSKTRRSSASLAPPTPVTTADILRWAGSSKMLAGPLSTLIPPNPQPSPMIPKTNRASKWIRRRQPDDLSGSEEEEEDEDDYWDMKPPNKPKKIASSAEYGGLAPTSLYYGVPRLSVASSAKLWIRPSWT
ncbi:hypothetical protein HDU87_006732 [Geranomyces variabilis]|uniref:Uncharacterized protein n=1 Tax=Geranomyces variabilis TaxID=109894 RepID=A0AAD5XQE2_9FUNG|nr:hypothetical protein HDU87_006732 [Geranomyces variabilis]